MSATTTETAAPANQPDPITLHWIMTAQTDDGRQGTNDGRIAATPGVHTHESTYTAVLKAMEEWMGTPHFTVTFFSLTPNHL